MKAKVFRGGLGREFDPGREKLIQRVTWAGNEGANVRTHISLISTCRTSYGGRSLSFVTRLLEVSLGNLAINLTKLMI